MTYSVPRDVPAAQPATVPRKKRRIFLWVFLAIQALFLAWIIAGVATANNTPAHSDVLSVCGHGGWRYLYSSFHDCMTSYAGTLKGAGDTGTAIGAGLVIGLWVAVDVILGLTYGIYRLASRNR